MKTKTKNNIEKNGNNYSITATLRAAKKGDSFVIPAGSLANPSTAAKVGAQNAGAEVVTRTESKGLRVHVIKCAAARTHKLYRLEQNKEIAIARVGRPAGVPNKAKAKKAPAKTAKVKKSAPKVKAKAVKAKVAAKRGPKPRPHAANATEVAAAVA